MGRWNQRSPGGRGGTASAPQGQAGEPATHWATAAGGGASASSPARPGALEEQRARIIPHLPAHEGRLAILSHGEKIKPGYLILCMWFSFMFWKNLYLSCLSKIKPIPSFLFPRGLISWPQAGIVPLSSEKAGAWPSAERGLLQPV